MIYDDDDRPDDDEDPGPIGKLVRPDGIEATMQANGEWTSADADWANRLNAFHDPRKEWKAGLGVFGHRQLQEAGLLYASEVVVLREPPDMTIPDGAIS